MAAHDRAPSSFSSGSTYTYDVFLSFRGPDTGNSFTAFLHKHLVKEGVVVYIDREDLRPGEEIKSALFKAIQGSKISIPVFSKGYADSRWCLDELVEIVRCHRDNGQIILPIFLDVDPRDVRHQIGCFQISFEKHKDRFDEQTINSWKEALKEVAAISGYDLGQVTGNESKLVDSIVERVLSESSGKRLDDVKNPVGLDERVKEVEDRLCIGLDDVQLVGIWGTGGIGKTTIAKTLYNRIFKSFRRSCFLANVKGEEASGPKGLVNLQEQLIYSISKWKVDENIGIMNVDRGKQLIREKLQGENVLLIFDDVDSPSQLNALAIESNWFGPASRIVITSRDKHILKLAKVDEDKIYCPEDLDDEQSLRLFSLHAFSSFQPPEEYLQLSLDVIHYAGGLPLTLVVLGSTFSDEDNREEEVWKSMLQELERIPHDDVHKKLKISYDNLNDHEKSIFLDVACCFIGKTKEIMVPIWDACGFNPISAIKKLTQRSLLEVDDDKLWMHDQVKLMGRRIVSEESPEEPSKCSRIWSDEEILNAIEEPEEAEMLEVIFIGLDLALPDDFDYWYYFRHHQPLLPHRRNFAMMSKLRVLNVYGIQSERDFPHLPPNLRWFRWNDLIVPTNFYHKKLVHMDLSHAQIGEAWTNKPQNEKQLFQKLKVLCLRNCDASRQSLDFSWFPYLETLNLHQCKNFLKLHKSIGDLNSLVELHLGFTEIEELPNSICSLSSLKVLKLGWCLELKNLPESIGDLKSLVRLDLGHTEINEIPSNIYKLSCLEVLILEECQSLKNLPESIRDLKSLVQLNLEGVKIEEIPSSIFKLSCLTKLNLNCCISLKKSPNDVWLSEKLEELEARNCYPRMELPIPWGRMRCLRIIDLTGSRIFLPRDDYSSTTLLPSLVKLEIGNDLESSLPPWISGLPRLQHLKLYRYTELESLPDLPSTLTSLIVWDCGSLQTLPDLSSLSHLTKLYLWDCQELKEIRGFEGIVESLKFLVVSNCKYLEGNPRWKIHGQGTLLVDRMPWGFDNFLVDERSEGIDIYSSNVNDGIYKGLILCVVFKCPSDQQNVQEGQLVDVSLSLAVLIRRRKHGWTCHVRHNVVIEGVEYTSERDIIYVHHFKGFDWFGIPLEPGIDDINVMGVHGTIKPSHGGMWFQSKVKFWKVFLESTASEQQQQITNQEEEFSTTTTIARRMVANFFSWSDDEDHGRSHHHFVPQQADDESSDEMIDSHNDPIQADDESSDEKIESHDESSDEMIESHNDPIQADDESGDEMIDSHNDPIQADDERSNARIPIMLRCWAWICS